MSTPEKNRLISCLQSAGLPSLPDDPAEPLEPYGLDSLIKAMAVINIEREFKIRISTASLEHNPLSCLNDFLKLIPTGGA